MQSYANCTANETPYDEGIFEHEITTCGGNVRHLDSLQNSAPKKCVTLFFKIKFSRH